MGFLILLMLSLFSSTQAYAELQLTHEMQGLPVTANTHVIEDPQRKFTIDDILKMDEIGRAHV